MGKAFVWCRVPEDAERIYIRRIKIKDNGKVFWKNPQVAEGIMFL